MMISKNKTNKFAILVASLVLSSENINATQQLSQKNEEQRHIIPITDQLNSAELEGSFSFFDSQLSETDDDIVERDPAEIAKTIFRPSRPRTSILSNSPHIETLSDSINIDFEDSEQQTEEVHKIMHRRTNSEFVGINFRQLDQ